MGQQILPRILVVDDDPGVLASYRLVLEEQGEFTMGPDIEAVEREIFGTTTSRRPASRWNVRYADQGEIAIALVKKGIEANEPFTAVFLDVRMPPGLDGYDTAEEMRKLDSSIHIVVVSGFSDFTEADLLEVAGPRQNFTMLPKPVWPADLQRLAARLCNGTTEPY